MRKQFCQTALGNCYGLKLPKCWLQFTKKNYCVIYYKFRHTFVPYSRHIVSFDIPRVVSGISWIRFLCNNLTPISPSLTLVFQRLSHHLSPSIYHAFATCVCIVCIFVTYLANELTSNEWMINWLIIEQYSTTQYIRYIICKAPLYGIDKKREREIYSPQSK